MTTNDGSIGEPGNHPTTLAAVPVWEGLEKPKANVLLDERDHGSSEGPVRQGRCRPELPICPREYR